MSYTPQLPALVARLGCSPHGGAAPSLPGKTETLATSETGSAIDLAPTSEREGPPAPIFAQLACFTCRCTRFWRSPYGEIICGRCHPPAAPGLVAEWVESRRNPEPVSGGDA